MSHEKVKFAILGTGNSGQDYAAHIALSGHSVNLAEVPEFEENLRAIERNGGIKISGDAKEGFAKLDMITTDLVQAIKGVDVIIIGGSAFAHEVFSKSLMNDFEDGQFILFTSNFGALRFIKWKKEADVTTKITPVELVSLPYATRAIEPGVVEVFGVKDNLPVAALPASRTQEFLDKVMPVFPSFKAADNVWLTSVNNLNPVVHPPMVLFNAGRIESTGGEGWGIYSDGATESVAKVMLAVDGDRELVCDKVSEQGRPFKDIFEDVYNRYSVAKPTLSETLRQSSVHSHPSNKTPPVVNSRYITEDMPYGLVPWSSIGRMWGIPTPNIDMVIQIASIMSDVNYFEEGLKVEDLGIDGMTPDQVRALIA